MQTRIAPWAAAAALALAPALLPAAARAGSLSVVMSGLNNPYGLTFGPDGGLYVAEAGTGGPSTAPSLVNGNGATVYFGDTGRVSELLNGVQSQVITGLPSLGPAGGGETTGLQGLTVSGGSLYGVYGLGAMPSQLATLVGGLPSGSNAVDLGQLVNFGLVGSLGAGTPVSDVAGYETQANYQADNPDHSVIEANPYGVTGLSGGGFAVTDGGGNVVLKVAAGGGAPTLLTALSPVPNTSLPHRGGPTLQSVPTGITTGPNGLLYVGEFTGFPFPAGGADVFRINPATGAASILAGGFTTITGLAYGPGGDLYVLDQSTSSYAGQPSDAQLFQLDPTTGTKTRLTDLAFGTTYSSLTAGPDNALYFSSQGSNGPGSGQVLRYSLATAVPEPSPLSLLSLGLLPLGLAARRRARRAA